MFHRPGKKRTTPITKPLGHLTAIVPPQQLLSNGKRQALMMKITASCGLALPRFDALGLTLIQNLIDHCQSMPETSNSYYALTGGLLDHALNRTEAALSLFRNYIVNEPETDLSEEQQLWGYALLSASILQGISKLQIDYHVDLFDKNGQLLKKWNPLLESMGESGSYYQFEFQSEGDLNFRHRLNLLFARLLMPVSGFNWIASNPQVLAIWLALLNEDTRTAGTLGAILIRADAIAIQRYFTEGMVIGQTGGRPARPNRLSRFIDPVPATLEQAAQGGVEFIQWLTNQLKSGLIMINKAPLMMVPGGLLISPELFKLFIREHPEYKNWQAIQKSFLALGLHQLNADGEATSRFEQPDAEEMLEGIIFSNYAVALPDQMKLHHSNTDMISSISAIEVVHMGQLSHQNFYQKERGAHTTALPHLSAKGTWQLAEEKRSTLQSENTRGG